MARPRKDPTERKDSILRIPLTEDQLRLIVEAAKLDGAETATWVRPLIVKAAEQRIRKEASRSGKVR